MVGRYGFGGLPTIKQSDAGLKDGYRVIMDCIVLW
jgi:hypothetical protein